MTTFLAFIEQLEAFANLGKNPSSQGAHPDSGYNIYFDDTVPHVRGAVATRQPASVDPGKPPCSIRTSTMLQECYDGNTMRHTRLMYVHPGYAYPSCTVA